MNHSSANNLIRKNLCDLFWQLRGNGLSLGIDDLLAAVQLFDSDWPADKDWGNDLKMLWLRGGSLSEIELAEIEVLFDRFIRQVEDKVISLTGPNIPDDNHHGSPPPPVVSPAGEQSKTGVTASDKDQVSDGKKENDKSAVSDAGGTSTDSSNVTQSDKWPTGEKTESPNTLPQAVGNDGETGILALPTNALRFQANRGGRITVRGPINRLSMVYAWHSLRQIRRDGPLIDLDLDATIDRVARERYYTGPVFRRSLCLRTRLLLLVDRRGSMGPFHHLTNDLVETATLTRAFAKLEIRYFHNLFSDYLYHDPFLNNAQKVEALLRDLDARTKILIVSDAGAARGHFNPDRIVATIKLIVRLRKARRQLIWLNPMPSDRWEDTSAEAISYAVPMYPLDRSGIFKAFRHLRNL
jgi:uncharacterized protein with von Willebrand factor type A (vWA) domain